MQASICPCRHVIQTHAHVFFDVYINMQVHTYLHIYTHTCMLFHRHTKKYKYTVNSWSGVYCCRSCWRCTTTPTFSISVFFMCTSVCRYMHICTHTHACFFTCIQKNLSTQLTTGLVHIVAGVAEDVQRLRLLLLQWHLRLDQQSAASEHRWLPKRQTAVGARWWTLLLEQTHVGGAHGRTGKEKLWCSWTSHQWPPMGNPEISISRQCSFVRCLIDCMVTVLHHDMGVGEVLTNEPKRYPYLSLVADTLLWFPAAERSFAYLFIWTLVKHLISRWALGTSQLLLRCCFCFQADPLSEWL